MVNQMLYVHALSPVHMGVGQGAGVIDLPVIREKTTRWPYLPGTGVKGVLRDACRDEARIVEIFGPEPNNVDEGAGGIAFPDLHLLCWPVRSARGSFAWVTSLHAVNRWLRDSGTASVTLPDGKHDVADDTILLSSTAAQKRLECGDAIRLEDRLLKPVVDEGDWIAGIFDQIATACFDDDYWREFFLERVGLVSDDAFTYFTVTATEITAHNRIDDQRKVVAKGQLWWEEAVPAESIFAGPITPVRQDADELIDIVRQRTGEPLQMGGNASVGRGIVRVRIPGEAAS